MNRMTLAIAATLLALAPAWAASIGDPKLGAIARDQALKDLGTDLRLMCVAAHPDDEDGATLAYYRKKYGIKTFALIATRGEGGQNEIGPELYEELGVIRTHEMQRASQITGAELHFLDMPEFGYSKSIEETYRIWGEEETLRRMVRKIRETRPDVIITHHPPDRAHGHHQAVGDTLQKAFDVAGDPSVFPEQIQEGLEAWQPSRLYLRDFGNTSATHVVVPISELDPARGITYARVAANALEEHESQGMGFFVDRFLTSRSTVYYDLIQEAPQGRTTGVAAPGGALFDGLNDRVSESVRELAETARAGSADLKAIARVARDASETASTRADANAALAVLHDFRVQVKTDDDELVPGQTLTIAVEAQDYGSLDAGAISVALEALNGMSASLPKPVELNAGKSPINIASLQVTIPDGQPPTIPHSEKLFDEDFLAPQFAVNVEYDTPHGPVTIRHPVLVDIAPPVYTHFSAPAYLVRNDAREVTVGLRFSNHAPSEQSAEARLDLPKGISADVRSISVTLAEEGHQVERPIAVTAARDVAPGDYPIRATTGAGTAEAVIRVVDVDVPAGIHVGVIQSYDDTFVKTLERFGVSHELLSVEDFTPERLSQFDTIIVDIRAYLVREDLLANNATLLEYARQGGTVIVNYQKTFEWRPNYAPYRIGLSRNRVTVEDAPIEILEPEHRLFNEPNKIVASDWDGWRQERGLYFPSSWDDAYTPLIKTADPGEDPPPGSLLYADYGDGVYVYTALGWYRQLRDLHPGTLRIFANMLAL